MPQCQERAEVGGSFLRRHDLFPKTQLLGMDDVIISFQAWVSCPENGFLIKASSAGHSGSRL